MAQNEVIESSVQEQGKGYWSTTVFRLAAQYDVIPEWWSKERDAWLRGYWYQENFLASAVYAIANRNAAFGWKLTGLNDDVEYAQQLLQFADFSDGWQSFIIKTTIDLLTQDNGAFVECIRPAKVKLNGKTLPAIKEYNENSVAEWYTWDGNKRIKLKATDNIYDSPLDPVIGVAHLDAGQCVRTGDSENPVMYTDRSGKRHMLKWWQVLAFNEMPSPIEKMNGVGYCGVSRVFRTSHIMQSISLYNDEKVSGRFNRSIFLTNVDADAINDAIGGANQDADNRGLLRYSQPIVAATLKEDAPISLEQINLAEVPDNFEFNDLQNWYIANLALALGVDYGFLAPLPGKGLGTASQSETMMRQAKGKSSRLFMDMISNALNFKGVLPKAVTFEFDERDTDTEKTDEEIKKQRADRFQIYLEMGVVTPTVAQQMLSDAGDIPEVYLEQMGQEDTTPVTTVDGDENVQAVDEMADEVEAEEKHDHHIEVSETSKQLTKEFLTNLPYAKIKAQREKLFKKSTIFERVKNAARKAFGKKQVEIPPAPNEEVTLALEEYQVELDTLVEQANNGEIPQSEFEDLLSELVTQSLIAFYAATVGDDPEDFTEQDLANVEDEIAINIDSVLGLADAIYSGNYQPTEEEPDRPLMLITRMGLWLGSAAFLSWLGEIWNEDNAEKMYKWSLNPVKENCDSCIALDGQVHNALTWREFGVSPQSTELICFGKFCGCSRYETDETENGNLSAVPLR